MNKRYIAALISFFAAGILFFSCRKDQSSLDTNPIPGVVIDTTGNGSIGVFQFERLVVKPVLKTDLNESNLSYTWKINLLPNDTTYQVIGNTRDLDYEVRFKPNQSGKYHQLYYTVTDNNTGLQYIMTWPVTVKNNIGEGLVIAETNDQAHTDISHIMAPQVTSNYNGESVKHHVYSSINGGKINGIVKQLRFASIFGVDALLAITNESILRVNTLDYTFGGMNNDLFYPQQTTYQPQALGAVYQGDVYVGNGKLTATYLGANRKFGLPFDATFTVPDHVALNGNSANTGVGYQPPVVINFYDETNGHFVYQAAIQFGDTKMHAYPSVTGKAFNPAALPNKTNLAAGISSDRGFLHLLKDRTSGNISLYVFDGGVSQSSTPDPPQPVALFDLSNAPEINNATRFVLLDDQKVMYYATPTKIYAVLYGTSTPVYEERYTVPAGETITTLQVYRQTGYPLLTSYIATNNKQLILSTYGTEGKVYLLPMINPGLGNIDQPNIRSFGGFDRITAITPQK